MRRAMAVEDRPSLIVLRSHIGYPSPDFTDSPKAHGDPFPPEEIARTKEILGLPPDGLVLRARRRRRCLPPAHRRAGAARCGPSGRPASTPTSTAAAADRAVWDACWAQTGLDGWDKDLPRFQLGEKIATRQAVQKAINATAGQAARHRERRRRPHRQHRHEARRRRDPVAASTPAAASSTTASASTRMGAAHERHGRPRRHHPRRRHVLLLQRLRAARHPPRRPQHREGRSSSSPTTRSASVRTAPPTSRSSSWRRCGPCPSCR